MADSPQIDCIVMRNIRPRTSQPKSRLICSDGPIGSETEADTLLIQPFETSSQNMHKSFSCIPENERKGAGLRGNTSTFG
jgi:hypothetical protein